MSILKWKTVDTVLTSTAPQQEHLSVAELLFRTSPFTTLDVLTARYVVYHLLDAVAITLISDVACTVFFVFSFVQRGKSAGVEDTSCTRCPAGKFQDETGKSTCKECPSGSTKDSKQGATSLADCTECSCPPGTYISDDCSCQHCPQGTYSEEPNQSDQTACLYCSSKFLVWYLWLTCTRCV